MRGRTVRTATMPNAMNNTPTTLATVGLASIPPRKVNAPFRIVCAPKATSERPPLMTRNWRIAGLETVAFVQLITNPVAASLLRHVFAEELQVLN